MRSLVITSLLCVAFPRAAAAQHPTDPLQWTRVRITVWDPPTNTVRVGILSRVTADSLMLARGNRTVGVPRDRVLLVEASDGGDGMEGALAGFGIGALVGFVAVQTYLNETQANDEYNIIAAFWAGLPLGGFLGASIGGTITRERWSPVTLSPMKDGGWTAALRFSTPW